MKKVKNTLLSFLNAVQKRGVGYSGAISNEEIVERLIEQGLMVQVPISSVESPSSYGDGKVLAYDVRHNVWDKMDFSFVACHPDWYSHWMPLPAPMKKR